MSDISGLGEFFCHACTLPDNTAELRRKYFSLSKFERVRLRQVRHALDEVLGVDYAKLAEMVNEPRTTEPDVPLDELVAQREAAAATVKAPCPYCGETRPALLEWEHDPFQPSDPLWHAECQGCGAHGPVTSKAQDAAIKWNVRGAEVAAAPSKPMLPPCPECGAQPLRLHAPGCPRAKQ